MTPAALPPGYDLGSFIALDLQERGRRQVPRRTHGRRFSAPGCRALSPVTSSSTRSRRQQGTRFCYRCCGGTDALVVAVSCCAPEPLAMGRGRGIGTRDSVVSAVRTVPRHEVWTVAAGSFREAGPKRRAHPQPLQSRPPALSGLRRQSYLLRRRHLPRGRQQTVGSWRGGVGDRL